MSRREDIDTATWGDPDFRRLPPDAKLVYFWSFTHGCNMAGIFKLDEPTVALASGLTVKRLTKALTALEDARFIVRHGQHVWVRSRVKHLRSTGPRMATSIAGIVGDLEPTNPLRVAFLEQYAEKNWLREALSSITVESGNLEPNKQRVSIGSTESVDPQGQGQGQGQGPSTFSENSKDYSRDFEDFAADHAQVTGSLPPKTGTKARQARLEAFTARREEGWSLDDLKDATRGAFTDSYRREHGHYDLESVLRPTKVDKLVNMGRRFAAGPLGTAPTAADRGVTDMLEAGRRLREEDAA